VISLWGAGFAQAAPAGVTLVLTPRGTTVGELAGEGMAVGLMSAGMGDVPAAQTYLDVSQGNRVFDSLYDAALPSKVGGGICGPAYSRAVAERAESAPAEIQPGLLAATLHGAGKGCTLRRAGLSALPPLLRDLRGDDLVIAIERAPPERNGALAIGVAGRGFDGELTSESTRTRGYVLSTDIAPTILRRFGLGVPDAMSGQPIRAEGSVDLASLDSLASRMKSISERRGPVIGVSLATWLLTFGLAALLAGGRATRAAVVELLCLSIVYLPLLLLLCAALEPGQGSERLLVLLGSPLAAALTLALCRGYRAIAIASGIVVLAHALDVLAGSHLTRLSLLGPNPGLGVRFYGIGNELEALLAVLVVAGTGAALSGFAPLLSRRRIGIAFLAVGLACALVFAAGRFGADVGAAIVMPIGAAAAASKVATPRRHAALSIIAISFAFVGLIALIDLISGANAHLTRSVLDAGGLGDLAQVAQRRLSLSVHSFSRPIVFVFLPLLALAAALAMRRRATLRRWLADAPAVEAGLLGALVAVVAGTLANDSGALVLEIGGAYLLVFVAFAWTTLGSPCGSLSSRHIPGPTRAG
jgi:hypothetical protein